MAEDYLSLSAEDSSAFYANWRGEAVGKLWANATCPLDCPLRFRDDVIGEGPFVGYHIEGTGDLAKAVHVQMRALVDAELDRQKNRQKIEQLAMKIRAQLDQLSSPVVEALDGLGVAGAPTAKKHDPQTVLPLLTAERIRRATQLNKAIATDLAARESTSETAGLEELFQAVESPVPVRRGSARGP